MNKISTRVSFMNTKYDKMEDNHTKLEIAKEIIKNLLPIAKITGLGLPEIINAENFIRS